MWPVGLMTRMTDWLAAEPYEREASTMPAAHAPRITIPPWPSYAAVLDEGAARNIPAFVRALRLIAAASRSAVCHVPPGRAGAGTARLLRQPEPVRHDGIP